ncbi:response regulator [Rhodanobacter lindaniclasticus]|uniref:DNA-binding response regulator n=1 Tax=Rhodanobacter lindaniclasticus TaxID=75310 RepID=A0A4S3KID2_9GAMM|nr:response regulator transcription factor [Rhodanobacter lindaniclasticus]THD08502.1 DNA-binding response regulator [Rhodanobacter lindaniclasticus]
MRILLVEDDPSIAEGIRASLRQGGHAVDHVTDGGQADAALRDHGYDLLVLDLGLPGLDGSEVLQRLRRRGKGLPVLVVTARDGLAERIRVLDLGADDYLVKPFALSEFEARVRALLRRVSSQGKPELQLGRLRLDLPGHRAWVDRRPLELTAREFGLLEALALRADRVTSRAQLIEALCDWDQELTDNGLDIAIHRLRRKLDGSGTGVRTIRGLGYLLEELADAGDAA